ncbi:MAG: hypothetical protein ACI33J_02145 [Clostridium sp.]
MEFLEHISKIDNIIKENRQKQYETEMFNLLNVEGEGLGFSSVIVSNQRDNGSLSSYDIMENGNIHHISVQHGPIFDTYNYF